MYRCVTDYEVMEKFYPDMAADLDKEDWSNCSYREAIRQTFDGLTVDSSYGDYQLIPLEAITKQNKYYLLSPAFYVNITYTTMAGTMYSLNTDFGKLYTLQDNVSNNNGVYNSNRKFYISRNDKEQMTGESTVNEAIPVKITVSVPKGVSYDTKLQNYMGQSLLTITKSEAQSTSEIVVQKSVNVTIDKWTWSKSIS